MRRPSKSIGRTRAEVAIDDVSRDVSRGGDRRLWLLESCPACGASPGARCRRPRGASRQPILHVARGWRQRRCPVCQAGPGEACVSPSGRTATGSHAARRGPARGELSVVGRCGARLRGPQRPLRVCGSRRRARGVRLVVAAAAVASLPAGVVASELGDARRAGGRAMACSADAPIAGTLSWSVAGGRSCSRGVGTSASPRRWPERARSDRGARCRATGRRCRRSSVGCVSVAAVRSRRAPGRRRATAQSAAVRPPRASGYASFGDRRPGWRWSVARGARVRCRRDCGRRRAAAQSVVGRPPRAPGWPKRGDEVARGRTSRHRATSRGASRLGNPLSPVGGRAR